MRQSGMALCARGGIGLNRQLEDSVAGMVSTEGTDQWCGGRGGEL
jgi:hypothetical protein